MKLKPREYSKLLMSLIVIFYLMLGMIGVKYAIFGAANFVVSLLVGIPSLLALIIAVLFFILLIHLDKCYEQDDNDSIDD